MSRLEQVTGGDTAEKPKLIDLAAVSWLHCSPNGGVLRTKLRKAQLVQVGRYVTGSRCALQAWDEFGMGSGGVLGFYFTFTRRRTSMTWAASCLLGVKTALLFGPENR